MRSVLAIAIAAGVMMPNIADAGVSDNQIHANYCAGAIYAGIEIMSANHIAITEPARRKLLANTLLLNSYIQVYGDIAEMIATTEAQIRGKIDVLQCGPNNQAACKRMMSCGELDWLY